MATLAFPALGFDPAPGDPDRVDALAAAADRAAGVIGTASQRLAAARRSPEWDGDAATAFHVDIGRLPADLDCAAAAYGRARTALRQYGAQLRFAQAEARSLEEQARQIADRRTRATLLDDPITQFRSRAEADEHDAEIVRSARRLAERLDVAGNRAATLLLTAAATVPYRRPGMLAGAGAEVKGWIDENAESLRTASTALKAVSAVAGLLAFVPVLTPICTPLAIGTAAAALGVDAALAAAGEGNWRRVAVEAVTTLLPGGRVIRGGGTAARPADRILDAVNSSARGAVRADVLAEEPDTSRRVVPSSRVEGAGSKRRVVGRNSNATERPSAERSATGLDDSPITLIDVDATRPEPARAPDQNGLPRSDIDELVAHIVPGSGKIQ